MLVDTRWTRDLCVATQVQAWIGAHVADAIRSGLDDRAPNLANAAWDTI
jgi:hypothetical protein